MSWKTVALNLHFKFIETSLSQPFLALGLAPLTWPEFHSLIHWAQLTRFLLHARHCSRPVILILGCIHWNHTETCKKYGAWDPPRGPNLIGLLCSLGIRSFWSSPGNSNPQIKARITAPNTGDTEMNKTNKGRAYLRTSSDSIPPLNSLASWSFYYTCSSQTWF